MNFIKTFSHQIQQLVQRTQRRWHWHWLDGLILMAIIIALTGLLLIRSQRKTQWVSVQIEISQEEWWWQGMGPQHWYLDQLQPGTVSYNSFGSQVAKVDKVELMDIGQGRRQAIVTVQLKVSYDDHDKQYLFGFQPLQIGRAVELSFSKQQLKGLVTSIDQPNLPVVERSVRIRVNKVDPNVAATYHVGLQSLTDNNEVVAIITQLKVTPALNSEFSDIRGKMVQVIDPALVDVSAVIRLRLTKDGDRYYFADGLPVKVGEDMVIQFPQTILKFAQVLEWMDEPTPVAQ